MCIKNISIIIISVGIISGLIQIIRTINKDKKVVKAILYIVIIILTFIISFIVTFYYIFIANVEEHSQYEGQNMIKETRQVLKSNYIKYYDYINPFIRSRQERIYINYDDTISEDEYGGTYYYNKDAKEVQDIKGTSFIDLSNLKKYASEGNATYENIQDFLKDIYTNYEKNIYKVETSENYLFIYLTNIQEKFVMEEIEKHVFKIFMNKISSIGKTKLKNKMGIIYLKVEIPLFLRSGDFENISCIKYQRCGLK